MKNTNKGVVIWLTGLSGAGKTTIALALEEKLKKEGISRIQHLDGDIVRRGLSRDLGFSKKDRDENIERVSFVADLLYKHGVVVLVSFISPYLVSFISPYIKQRQAARERIKNFLEIFVNCPLEICEQRDVKGMYKKARAGKIKNFTGINDPYELPVNPDVELNTDKLSVEESVEKIYRHLLRNNYLDRGKA